MPEVTVSIAIWGIRAEDIKLTPNEQAPHLLRLQFCEDVRIMLDREAADTAEQAVALRELARLATEAAEELERHTAAQAPEARDA